jgi:hypothetical protein
MMGPQPVLINGGFEGLALENRFQINSLQSHGLAGRSQCFQFVKVLYGNEVAPGSD